MAPFHLFNPPPAKLKLQAKLHNTASSSNDEPRYEFMLQLPRQRMRPAMRVLSDVLGRGTAWRLLPPSTPEQLAPTPAQLETEEGNSVPTLHPESAHAARLPSLPTDDGAASSHRREEPPSSGMNTLQPPGALPTRLEGAGLSCDLQPDGSLQFVMRDDPQNECAPLPDCGAVTGFVGSGVGVQLCVVKPSPPQVQVWLGPKPANPLPPVASQVWGAT